MLVSIIDFAASRNIDKDTVNTYIRRHPEIKAAVRKDGKNVVIDTETAAYALLDKQYPLPQMIQVVEDKESRAKLIKAQEMIIQLQTRLNEQSQRIAEAEAIKILLDDKQMQLKKTQDEVLAARNEVKVANDRVEELRQQLAEERAKTWWQKLRGK